METVCQISFSLLTIDEANRTEKILREYLLSAADSVRMARVGSSYLSFQIIPHPIKFKKFTNMLSKEDVKSSSDHEWVFAMTDNIKKYLNQVTLFSEGKDKIFHGFTDPKFYKGETEIASMISNERILNLYIPDSDKAELAKKGVYLDSPQI